VVGAYLDASVLVSLILGEPSSDAVERWITDVELPLLVSDFAAAEVSSAISLAVRQGRETASNGAGRLSDFDDWRMEAPTIPIAMDPEDVRMADQIVRAFDLGLRAPDALHVAMAQRLNARLITLDRRLMRAASALGVEAISPGGPN
jgi:uncharacterized protein